MENPWPNIEDNIIDQYLNDYNQRPWIVAFSGGKDSTTLLQMVWNSILKIDPDKRTRRMCWLTTQVTLGYGF